MHETQEKWVQSLHWKVPLEEGMATHYSILAWRLHMDREAWWATVHRVRVGHDRACTHRLQKVLLPTCVLFHHKEGK